MRKHVKWIAIAVVALMLAGCGGSGGESDHNDPNPTPAPNGEDLVTADTYYPFTETLMDLEGRTITMLCIRAGRGDNRWDYDWDDIDRTPNETLAVMQILRDIETEYNANIEIYFAVASGLVTRLAQYMTAGDAPFDLFETGLTEFGIQALYTQGIVMPVTHPSIIDIIMPHDNPWLEASSFSVVGDTQFAVHFKPSNTPDILRATLIFNRTLQERFGLPNFYQMVRDREWTWDAFDNILSQVVTASNGDVFPIIHGHEGLIVPQFIFSNNGYIARHTPNGIEFVGDVNDNALAAMNLVVSFAERGFFHPLSGTREPNVGNVASDGEAMFIFNWYDTMKNLRRQAPGHESDYNFGILPTPMGPQATEFMTSVYTEVLYHVMYGIDRPYQAAAILVAMANRTRTATYRLIEHELRYSLMDNDSAEMMEIMLSNVKIDISRIHGSARTSGGESLVAANNRMLNGDETPVVAMQRIAPSMQMWFDTLNTLDN